MQRIINCLKSTKVAGGLQWIKTNDGYIFPLLMCQSQPYLPLCPYADHEWDILPHVILTSDMEWDPSVPDHEYDLDDEPWFNIMDTHELDPQHNLFDEFDNYHKHTVCMAYGESSYDIDDIVDSCVHYTHFPNVHLHLTQMSFDDTVQYTPPDYAALHTYSAYFPTNIIKKTFENTTQYAKTTVSSVLKHHFKSPFLAPNVFHCHEPVATDIVYSNTPAFDDGSKHAQILVGTKTLLADVYGMKTDKQFVNTLEDIIHDHGVINKLLSDCAQVEIIHHVKDILYALVISSWQSEPHQQQQNPFEYHWRIIKNLTNILLDFLVLLHIHGCCIFHMLFFFLTIVGMIQ